MAIARWWLALGFLLTGAVLPARAAEESRYDEGGGQEVAPDPRILRQLDGQNLRYQVDHDGEFRLVYQLEGKRTHAVWIQSRTEALGGLELRELYAFAYRCTGPVPQDIANRLMTREASARLGSWERVRAGDDSLAAYVVRIPALAPVDVLLEAVSLVLTMADSLEQELTPGTDEF
jgi:hypothetical protein